MGNNVIHTCRSNWEKEIETTLNGYKEKIEDENWLSVALQKDAIQNSWDARIDKINGKNWKCTFSLLRASGKQYLQILDEGTRGLLGKVFNDKKEIDEILLSKKLNQDLAYFCNMNWSVKSGSEGGTKGRGKMVLLGSSNNKKIFFDSVRGDKSGENCVSGEIWLGKEDKELHFCLLSDEKYKDKLGELGLKKLNKIGTRILIEEPNAEIIKSIKSGHFKEVTEATWWEIIKKYDASIMIVDDNGVIEKCERCKWYEDDIFQEETYENDDSMKISEKFNIKKIVLRYSSDREIPKQFKGISIQRGGMSIQILKSNQLVKDEEIANVFGWIELDEKLEEEIKNNCEGTEHFSIDIRKTPAKEITGVLREKIRSFAEKIGILKKDFEKKDKVQIEAISAAMEKLRPLFKKINIFGKGGNKNRKKRRDGGRNRKLIRLSVRDFKLPHESERVDYGEKIEGVYVIPVNEQNKKFSVEVTTSIVWGDYKENEEMLESKNFILSDGENLKVGREYLEITNKYKPGKYYFKSEMHSLEEVENIELKKGSREKLEKAKFIDVVYKRFFIGKDPVGNDPISIHAEHGGLKRNFLFKWEKQGDIYNVVYNLDHPVVKSFSSDKDKLGELIHEKVSLILYQIGLEEESESVWGDEIKNNEDYKEGKINFLEKAMNWQSEILWDQFNKE